jgi:hypothetical protein
VSAPTAAWSTPAAPAKISRLGATGRSALIPGWGQWATGHPVQGAIYAGLGAVTLGSAVVLAVRAKQANDIYEKQSSFAMRNQAYDQAASYSTSRNIMIAAAALVWAASATTAFIFYQP